jgi:hypothetical protein
MKSTRQEVSAITAALSAHIAGATRKPLPPGGRHACPLDAVFMTGAGIANGFVSATA